ncbi:MAG TPA: hypothetical protein VLT33_27935 [Labilithrix sp.]|nr:hypothetical protein [Labilithrix sp.]
MTTPQDLASARDLLERFMEHGDRHLFNLRDGRPFEGWVVEIGEDAVLVMDSGPLASDESVAIPLAEIDLGTLRYIEDGTVVPFAVT